MGGEVSELFTSEIAASREAQLYVQMLTIRRLDLELAELFRRGEFGGFLHLSVGQEAVATGLGTIRTENDHVTLTHRAHGHLLTWGASVHELVAEVYWRKSGISGGFAGHVHMGDLRRRIVGGNGVLGQNQPIAAGLALGLRLREAAGLVVSVFGEGTGNEGAVSEALNMSVVMGLPVLWVCERNHFAQLSPHGTHYPAIAFAARAEGFGMPALTVDGRDVEAVAAAADDLSQGVRSGGGPALLEVDCDRWEGHYVGDPQGYRETPEQDFVDPLTVLADRHEDLLTAEFRARAETAVDAELQDAIEAARSAPRVTWDEYLATVTARLPASVTEAPA